MSTLMDMFQSLCTKHLIPETRQKDIKTALRYLAAAYTSVPERLTLTNEMELMYKHVLREHLVAQGKKAATIRNRGNRRDGAMGRNERHILLKT